MKHHRVMFFILIITLSLLSNFTIIKGQTSDAEVRRIKNLQGYRLQINDLDVIRFKNLQPFKLQQNDARVRRYNNLQGIELGPNDARVRRFGNLQYFTLVPYDIDYKVDILNLVLTDQSGIPSTSYVRGDVVQANFTVKNGGALESIPIENGLVSILVKDPSETPIFLTYTYVDLPREASEELLFGYRVPLEASTGIYKVKVLIFSDWPSLGGLGLAVQEVTFSVN